MVVDRIVGALVVCLVCPPAVGWCVLCCLCRPISASQLEWPLRAVHSWSINPVVYWGPPTTPKGWCGYLILKMVSRLDAFSGYPSRT